MEISKDKYFIIEIYKFSDFTFKQPFRLIVLGTLGTGKNTFCFSIIENIDDVISPKIKKLYISMENINMF